MYVYSKRACVSLTLVFAISANLYKKYKLKLMGNARWVYHKVMVQIEYFYAKSKGHLPS